MKMKLKRFFLLVASVMLCAVCGLLVACGGGKDSEPESSVPQTPGAIVQTSIKYDGSVITWDAVDHAKGYQISINQGNEMFSSTNQFNYVAPGNVESVEVTVYAKGEVENGDSATKIFTRLPAIDVADITFSETGEMSWPAVDGATGYIVKVNGQDIPTSATEFATFEFGKRNTIQIKPVAADDSSFSKWSTAIYKDYLGAPSNIQYDGQFLTFTGSTAAEKYLVYINGSYYAEAMTTTYLYAPSNPATFDVQLQAIGDGKDSFDSAIGESKRFVFLADITGIKVEDGVLVWNAVPEASGYKVEIDGVEYTVETNRYENLSAGKEHKIKVKPVTSEGETYFANWSEETRVRILVAPTLQWETGLNFDDGMPKNALYWTKVDGDVGGYAIKVISPDNPQGEVVQLGPDAVQYANAFAAVGEYKISIKTIPVADSNSDESAYSEEVTVIRLATPNRPKQMQDFIKSNSTRVVEGVDIAWQPVSGATGYQIYKENGEINGTVTTTTTHIPYDAIMTAETTEAQVYNYKIQALGSDKTFETDRYVTLSSLKKDMLTATISVLAQPQDLTFEGYTASWTSIDDAKGYSISGGGSAATQTTQTTQYDLSNLEAGAYTFSICSIGNGSDLLPSNYTPAKNIVRLAPPTDIHLVPDEDGDALTWSAANSNADHFEVYWNDEPETAVNATELGDIGKYITTGSRGLFMRAVANYEDQATGTYFITSKPSATVTFIKLEPVTFNNELVRGNKFVWNAPGNVDGTSIQYRVYQNNGIALDGIVNACEYDISTLPAGHYDFQVVAIGNGTKFVSSEKSAAASFTKLDTPEVTTPANGTSFTWNAVPGEVQQYTVEIDGEIVEQIKPVSGQLTYSYEYKFPTIKPNGYAVRIYAQGNGRDTVNSNAWTKTQMVKAANKPGFALEYCDASYNKIEFDQENAQFVIRITNLAKGYTTGYEVEIGGTTGFITKSEGQYTEYYYKPDQVGKFEARVYAIGGVFDEAGNYYVRSETEEPKTVTVFNAPSRVEPTSSAITWKAVDGAGKYLVKYWIDGQVTEKEVTTAYLSLVSGLGNQIERVEVCVIGNGTTTIGSKTAVWVRS